MTCSSEMFFFEELPLEIQHLILKETSSLNELLQIRTLSKTQNTNFDALLENAEFILNLFSLFPMLDAARFARTYKNLFEHDQKSAEKIICFALTTDDVHKINIKKLQTAIKNLEEEKRINSLLAKHLKGLCTIFADAHLLKTESRSPFIFLTRMRKTMRDLNFKRDFFINLQGIDLNVRGGIHAVVSDFPIDCQKLNLMGVNFTHCHLSVDFSQADLSYGIFKHAYLPACKMHLAHLYHADFSDANLQDGSFIHATLDKANLTRAELSNVDFSFASLVNANLENIIINEKTCFKDATFFAPKMFTSVDKFSQVLEKLKHQVGKNLYHPSLNAAIVEDIKNNVTTVAKQNLSLASNLLDRAILMLFPNQAEPATNFFNHSLPYVDLTFFKPCTELEANKKILEDLQKEIEIKISEMIATMSPTCGVNGKGSPD